MKSNWVSLNPRRLVLVKLAYDALCATIALVLAFVTRFALLFFERSPELIPPDIRVIYLSFFIKYAALYVVLTVGSLFLLGFYRSNPFGAKPWKPLMIVGGVSVGPVLWSLLMYYALLVPDPMIFPRGVSLLAWAYSLVLIGMPRILKYLILNRMVVDVYSHRRKKVDRVLVIGGAGYIGSQFCRDLIKKNYKVRILDSFLFGDSSLQEIRTSPLVDVVSGDFRNLETVVSAMNGIDAVVHLGGIVGDPACSLDDDFTTDINLTATLMLAEIAKAFKIERFIFASSCSVYGASSGNRNLTELSEVNPLSLYARTKVASEKVLLGMVSPNFSPTILRFATLFGLSPRPRFDLFVNLATAKAVKEKKFTVFGGAQWRPFVHVRDTSKALLAVLEAPLTKVRGEIFNVGSAENCVTIAEAGRLVARLIPGCEVENDDRVSDPRDYRVSFEKMNRVLNLKLEVSLEEGIKELGQALLSGKIDDYSLVAFSNLKQTEQAISESNENFSGSVVKFAKPTSKKLLKQVAGGVRRGDD